MEATNSGESLDLRIRELERERDVLSQSSHIGFKDAARFENLNAEIEELDQLRWRQKQRAVPGEG